MKSRKGLLYSLIAVDFIAILMSWAGLLLIEEKTILEVEKYILFYWKAFYKIMMGYPFHVSVLIAVTLIVYFILKFFGIRVD